MSKSIGSSVGKGGKNRPEDVVTIQYLLNCVPSKAGGPTAELDLDGLCGVLTSGAIVRFQQAALGFGDGRVDVGGQTFAALCGYDPYPNQKLSLPGGGGPGKSQGKRGGTPSSNSWDPFGYYNPAGKNYMKDGYEPANFGGKGNTTGKSSYGKHSSDASAGKGGEKQAMNVNWGGKSQSGVKGGGKSHEGIKGSSQGGSSGKWGGQSQEGIKGGSNTVMTGGSKTSGDDFMGPPSSGGIVGKF